MKIFISQSNYIPWRGFIDIIRNADIYIVYDSMQFTKNDWRNRNLIRNNGQAKWLSIPCGSSISRSIDGVFPTQSNWHIKHSQTLKHCYSKAPFWKEFGAGLQDVYQQLINHSLSEINIKLLTHILDIQNIKTKIIRDTHVVDREKLLNFEKSERLVFLCNQLGGDIYLTAPAAKSYLKKELFIEKSINVSIYEYPMYSSDSGVGRELSWIDTLMHEGSLFR